MNHVCTNSGKAWLLAARPKTLTGAITPVLVGCALAYSDGQLQWTPAVLCLLFACLMQVAANFINDLFDFLKGSDREDRLGPERACAQGWITPQAMKGGIAIVLTAAGLTGCSLLYHGWHHLPYQGWELVLIHYLELYSQTLEVLPEFCLMLFIYWVLDPVYHEGPQPVFDGKPSEAERQGQREGQGVLSAGDCKQDLITFLYHVVAVYRLSRGLDEPHNPGRDVSRHQILI